MMVAEMVNARQSGRRALVFTNYRDHAKLLRKAFSDAVEVETEATLLIGGVKDIDSAMRGDFIFTTFAFARDALNLPHLDTLFFATPPGDPLQPIGRLRDLGPEKKSLMVVDVLEDSDYSLERAQKRLDFYENRGLKVLHLRRRV